MYFLALLFLGMIPIYIPHKPMQQLECVYLQNLKYNLLKDNFKIYG